jgi:hypothetical protein
MLEEKKDKLNKKKDRISNGLQVLFINFTALKICDITIYLEVIIHLLLVECSNIFYQNSVGQ